MNPWSGGINQLLSFLNAFIDVILLQQQKAKNMEATRIYILMLYKYTNYHWTNIVRGCTYELLILTIMSDFYYKFHNHSSLKVDRRHLKFSLTLWLLLVWSYSPRYIYSLDFFLSIHIKAWYQGFIDNILLNRTYLLG